MDRNQRDLVELSSEQQDKLGRYQEIANEEDKQKAIGVLQSVGWDLQTAIEKQLMGDDQPAITTSNDTRNGQGGIDSDEELWDDMPDTQSASRSNGPIVTRRGAALSGLAAQRATSAIEYSSLIGPRRGRTTAIRSAPSPASVISRASVASRPDRTATHDSSSARNSSGRGSDSDDLDLNMDVDDNDTMSMPSADQRATPLIPAQFQDLDEAITNFAFIFEARYGTPRPQFYAGSLRAALKEAFEAPGRPVSERRPLAIYVHNDYSVASNIFAKEVMCSPMISRLLNHQYVTWGWDVTQRANADKLTEWLDMNDIRDSVRTLTMIPATKFPVLLIVSKEAGVAKVLAMCTGFETSADLMQKLMDVIDVYQHVRTAEEAEERQRQEREQMRQEQKREYDESLARDRAAQEELERQRREQMEEESRRRLAEERKADHMKKLAESLPDEPSAAVKDVMMVRMRFPDGAAQVRRFRSSEPLKNLVTFIESQGFDMDNYRVWNADVPKKDVVESFDLQASFADLKWPVREQVFVEEK